MNYKQFVFNPLGVNTYVLRNDSSCVIIDPACMTAEEEQTLVSYIEENNLRPEAIWFTHLHFDHVWGAAFAKERWHIKAYASADDKIMLETRNSIITQMWGLPSPKPFEIDHAVTGDETLYIGFLPVTALATPGHSPGGLCFYDKNDKLCFTGDTLFRGSVGRCDFPGGNQDDLLFSIRTKLLTLPGDTAVLPGHGPSSTIKDETMSNPYLTNI